MTETPAHLSCPRGLCMTFRTALDNRLSEQLAQRRQEGLLRQMRVLTGPAGPVWQSQGARKLAFCSNNYLGLANHPAVIDAVRRGLDQWGVGAGASRLISGNTDAHQVMQDRLAAMMGKESCLVFGSGFMANYAVLSTLPQRRDLIAIDKLVHASIIDGARASQAVVRSWPHRRTDKLKKLLDNRNYDHAFIVTDSLFSMDGDRANLDELADLKRRYDATLMVDEAHAFGCIGPDGAGCAADAGLADDVDIVVATFSKALGGFGGFVACSAPAAEYLVNTARAFIFTTAIPPVNCLAAAAALDVIKAEPSRRDRLLANGDYFRDRCRQMRLDIGHSDSYIVPIILGSAENAVNVAEDLWRRGFMVPAIRPPTVAPKSSRLRVSLMSEHTRQDIDALCDALAECNRRILHNP